MLPGTQLSAHDPNHMLRCRRGRRRCFGMPPYAGYE